MKSDRRNALKQLLFFASLAAAPWTLPPSRAQAKASKQAMQYQDQPKSGQQCDTCLQFIAPQKSGGMGACKVVEGEISPKGWCAAYVKKP